ncbi:MAG: hypothetical protein K2J83_01945 [Clostridia bacterium]|nr:hypothetical protein [Clostridia bacterium]
MKKKIAAVAALATCIALTATFTGCSLVSSDNQKDMEQVICEVDVSRSDKFPTQLVAYKDAITTTSIVKRDLVSYFLNVGYSYIQSGTSYEDTFNMLLDSLVENAVLTQYCTLELLAQSEDSNALEVFLEFDNDVERYEYLLGSKNVGTENVSYSDEVMLARYSLYTSLNSAIDNYEKIVIDEDDDYVGTATRTTPVNVGTEQEDYYPHSEDGGLDYYVYTGYQGYLLADSGIYQEDALEGTTRLTRLRAYNSFISNLVNNYLIDEKEDLTDIMGLDYIQNEYLTQLKARAVTKYFDDYEQSLESKLKGGDNEVTSYVNSVYNELLKQQSRDYSTASDFEAALDEMASDSFILYSPSTSDSDKFDGEHYGKYGFVYNILLPFSGVQSAELTALNSKFMSIEDYNSYYSGRNAILENITTVDQRSAWFNGATKYAFDATDSGLDIYSTSVNSNWLFFEDNLTDSEEGGRYEKLQTYTGSYPYNGSVYENEDGSFTLLGNKIDIDGMLAEFSAYINYVLGGEKVSFDNGYVPGTKNSAYYATNDFYKADDKDEVDYSKFVYASGKVDLGTFNKEDLLNPETDQYKAMSAVNELQFAYTTDTSVLSTYVGYSVSAYDTSYIKEFEYAAKLAISMGEGGFAVCAGDYGWHLIYATYVFDFENNGEVYTPDWTRVSTEGTFENLFFEMIKTNSFSSVSTNLRSRILSDFNKDTSVTKYQSRYQDLLDLDD